MLDGLKKLVSGRSAATPVEEAESREVARMREIEEAREKLRAAMRKLEARRAEDREKLLGKIFPERTVTQIELSGERGEVSGLAMDCALPGLGSGASSMVRMTLDNEIIDRMPSYFIGWDSCALLAQNWLIDRACTVPGEDAVSPGWELEYAESVNQTGAITEAGQVEQAKRLKEVEHSAEEFGLRETLKRAERLKKVFGYSLVIPEVEGVDMSKPYTPDTPIPRKSYKGLTVIEPMWLVPQLGANGLNPASRDFYNPEWYRIAQMDKRIHRSWCIKLIHAPVADRWKPAYFFGGVSLAQQIYTRVYAAETTANEAPNLAMTKRLRWITGSIENAVANPELIEERMRLLTELADNYSTVLVGEEGRVGQLDTTLTDFPELTMTQYQLAAAIAQIPVTKLMKTQVKGFDNSGNYERDDYNQSLVAIQHNDYTPLIQMHNQFFCRSEYGDNPAFTVRWNEIQLPSPKEAAEIRLIEAQRDAHLIHGGVISPDEAREKLRNDDQGGYTDLADVMEGEPLGGDLDDEDGGGNGDYVPDYVGSAPDKGVSLRAGA